MYILLNKNFLDDAELTRIATLSADEAKKDVMNKVNEFIDDIEDYIDHQYWKYSDPFEENNLYSQITTYLKAIKEVKNELQLKNKE